MLGLCALMNIVSDEQADRETERVEKRSKLSDELKVRPVNVQKPFTSDWLKNYENRL